jgi:putative heme-binding domain-containing protein
MMMMRRAFGFVVTWSLFTGSIACAFAESEPWADRTMTVRDGLVVWLDAARLPAAWQASGKSLMSGAVIDVWYDASGNGLHVVQRLHESQPRYFVAGDRAVVRFDGKDDFLAVDQPGSAANGKTLPSKNAVGTNREIDRFTAFVVAAPRSNAGGFRGFLAAHELGSNDYLTGFNIDMSGPASDSFNQINVEGRGFTGEANLMRSPLPFGSFHTIELVCEPAPQGVRLFVDGQKAGSRKRDAGSLRLDGLFVAARCYSNSADPPSMGSFLDGDIAEVLLYRRALGDEERTKVREYLARKHVGLTEAIAAGDRRGGRLLKPIDNPPLVQMLVPGFTVRELPVELTNLNNVRYRADGKLVALGYDGNIWLLSDTDGDGLEDKVEVFWDNQGRLRGPIGIALTPPGYKHGNGLFVASKGKLSLIVDTDGDDRADKEIIVATGWKEIPQNVDAIGVALAPDGSIYFALGTANYANGYLLDKDGKSQYDLASERGTVLRVSADFSRREIVCTGTRFPVSMAFNRHGDLFAAEQEGATWLPNGNPFDELLHLQPGRHYGFPPRHPRHLPNVIDEPSAFDYSPQHQSTCGMLFNEPSRVRATHQSESQDGALHAPYDPIFGPAWWQGDAIVCGESRGKLYRTKLEKTSAGYVAMNQTIACLSMLTVDACLSPAGDLVVCCHSGPPDWGTGPQGKGKLFKIRYEQHDPPQPVLAWTTSPREVRVAFDRPLNPLHLKNLAAATAIEYGPLVRAGDRFETLKPPYAVVQAQLATPRYDLPVLSASVSADRRTLMFATTPSAEAVSHAISLPNVVGSLREPSKSPRPGSSGPLPQLPAIDLGYDLTGVEVSWTAAGGDASWSGWLPHVDLAVSRTFTAGSAEHNALWPMMDQSGKLVLRAQLDLWNMLRPAVQPGSSLDHTPPLEEVTVIFRSSQPLEIRTPGGSAKARKDNDRFVAQFTIKPDQRALLPTEVLMPTGGAAPSLEVTFTTNEDRRERPLPLRRILVPWASLKAPPTELAAARVIPELAGGDWLRGRAVFHSDEAACAKCHQLRGQGGRIGPDLGNLAHRDYTSVLRDILQPSAAINPDHVNYTVVLKDGRVLSGVPVSSADRTITIGDNTGKEIAVTRVDIEEMKPSEISNMPADLNKILTPEKLRDLLTFLMTDPLEPAPLSRRDAPLPRRRADVDAALRALAAPRSAGVPPASDPAKPELSSARKPRPLHIALVAGPKDHGPDEHDYPLWQSRWAKLLSLAENVEVSQSTGWPTREQFDKADVIVFCSANPSWSADKGPDLDAYLARGGGLVYIHFAVNGGKAADQLAARIGLAAHSGIKYRHGPLDLAFPDPEHPITRGFAAENKLDRVHFVDESYWNMPGDVSKIHVLATAIEEDQPRPLLWTREVPATAGRADRKTGRVFVTILGHYTWTFDDPLFRVLLLRGMAWSAHEPADRIVGLATIGARVAE